MLSFNRDTQNEYRSGLGVIPTRKLTQTYSSLSSYFGSGAVCSCVYHFGGQIATTSGGSSE